MTEIVKEMDEANKTVGMEWLYDIFREHETELIKKFPLEMICRYIMFLVTETGGEGNDDMSDFNAVDMVIDNLDLDPQTSRSMIQYFIKTVTSVDENDVSYELRKAALVVITKLLGCQDVYEAIPEIAKAINNVEQTFSTFLSACTTEMDVEILDAYLSYVIEIMDQVEITESYIKIFHKVVVERMAIIRILSKNCLKRDHPTVSAYQNRTKNESGNKTITSLYEKLEEMRESGKFSSSVKFRYVILTLELFTRKIERKIELDMKDNTVSIELVKLVLERVEKVEILSVNQTDFNQARILAIWAANNTHLLVFRDVAKHLVSFKNKLSRHFNTVLRLWNKNSMLAVYLHDLNEVMEEVNQNIPGKTVENVDKSLENEDEIGNGGHNSDDEAELDRAKLEMSELRDTDTRRKSVSYIKQESQESTISSQMVDDSSFQAIFDPAFGEDDLRIDMILGSIGVKHESSRTVKTELDSSTKIMDKNKSNYITEESNTLEPERSVLDELTAKSESGFYTNDHTTFTDAKCVEVLFMIYKESVGNNSKNLNSRLKLIKLAPRFRLLQNIVANRKTVIQKLNERLY